MDDENKTVTITLREYQELRRDSAMLEALNNAGVDNWSGYDDALEEFTENYDDDEDGYEI